jgi:hypothetical protein
MATHPTRATKRDAGNGAVPPMADLSRQAQQLGAELSDIGDTLRELVDGCRGAARDRLRRQPYVVLAVAAGVGYVLGGGLPRGVVRGLLAVGGRVMLESVVANLAASAAPTHAPHR